jgi:DNA mismatch repair ATPase MutL
MEKEKEETPEVNEEEKKDDLLQGTFISNLSSDMEREIASRISNVQKQINNITQDSKEEIVEEVKPIEEEKGISEEVSKEHEEENDVNVAEEETEAEVEETKTEISEEKEEKEIEFSIPDLRGRQNKELNSKEVSKMIAKMKADIRSKIETYPELKFDRDSEVSKAINNISGEKENLTEISEEEKEKIKQAKEEIAEEYENLSKVSDAPDEIKEEIKEEIPEEVKEEIKEDEIKEPTISMEGVKIPSETHVIESVKVEDRTQFVSTEEVKNALQTSNEEVTSDTLAVEPPNVKTTVSETREVGEVNKEINVLESDTAIVEPVKPAISEEKPEIVEELEEEDSGRGFTELAKDMVESKFDLDSTQSVDTAKIREALKDSKLNPEFDKMYKETFGVDTVNVRREKEIEDLEKEKINASNTLSEVSNENMSVFADEEYAEEEAAEDSVSPMPKPNYKKLGIAFDKYILIEVKNEIFMVDSVVASEKVLFDSLRERYYSENDDRQELLIPDVIDLTTKQLYIARESREMLNKAGFEFEEFGENTIKLTSVPEICEKLNTKKLFGNILDGLENIAVIDIEEKEQKFIATIAATVVDNEIIELDEENADRILEELFMLDSPLEAFDGKNVALKMSKDDMEKRFSRK